LERTPLFFSFFVVSVRSHHLETESEKKERNERRNGYCLFRSFLSKRATIAAAAAKTQNHRKNASEENIKEKTAIKTWQTQSRRKKERMPTRCLDACFAPFRILFFSFGNVYKHFFARFLQNILFTFLVHELFSLILVINLFLSFSFFFDFSKSVFLLRLQETLFLVDFYFL